MMIADKAYQAIRINRLGSADKRPQKLAKTSGFRTFLFSLLKKLQRK